MADKKKKAASAAKRYQKSEMACNKPQRAPKGDKHKYVVKDRAMKSSRYHGQYLL